MENLDVSQEPKSSAEMRLLPIELPIYSGEHEDFISEIDEGTKTKLEKDDEKHLWEVVDSPLQFIPRTSQAKIMKSLCGGGGSESSL